MSAAAALTLIVGTNAALGQTPVRLPVNIPVQSSSPAVADINGDGVLDLIIVSGANGGNVGGGGIPTGGAEQTAGSFVGPLPVLPRVEREAMPMQESASAAAVPGGGSGSGQMYLHVLDGSKDYTTNLPGYPRPIGPSSGTAATAGVADVNFDGRLDVVVGGGWSNDGDPWGIAGGSGSQAFAFNRSGLLVPGWESSNIAFPPVQSAVALGDANRDGVIDAIYSDESTYLHRFGSLGTRWQVQNISDPVLASPSIGDTARRTGPGSGQGETRGDGMPEEVCGGVAAFSGDPVVFYDSTRCTINPNGEEDLILRPDISPDSLDASSSTAHADLDGDRTQDTVFLTNDRNTGEGRLVFIISNNGNTIIRTRQVDSAFPAFNPVITSLYAGFGGGNAARQYSSPAIGDLDGDGFRREIVVGSDGGRLYAVRYNPSTQTLTDLPGFVGGKVLDSGFSISSSPVLADIIAEPPLYEIAQQLTPATPIDNGPNALHATNPDADVIAIPVQPQTPEIIIGTDKGNVYVLRATGVVAATFDCTNGTGPDSAGSQAIVGAPVVSAKRTAPATSPFIVAANRRGVFYINLTGYATFNPFDATRAPWATFHRVNARDGAYPISAPLGGPLTGSISGQVPACAANTFVELLDQSSNPILDCQGSAYTRSSTSEGRFVFEQVLPGSYIVRVNGTTTFTSTVTAGVRSNLNLTTVTVGGPNDCNSNGIHDACDIATGTATDCNNNGVPDSCEPWVNRVYVRAAATGLNNGRTWADAYTDLQSALASLNDPAKLVACNVEIWVARGTYKPSSTLNQGEFFALRNGVAIYGGFFGTETVLTQRNVTANPTILSGDLLGNDGTNFTNYEDNSYNVVRADAVYQNAVLDGFTVQAGNSPYFYETGGGLFVRNARPTIRNCTFVRNLSSYGGGAVGVAFLSGGTGNSIQVGTDASFLNCTFIGNRTTDTYYNGGGAIFIDGTSPTFTNCSFLGNQSFGNGGAVAARDSVYGSFNNCVFSGNRADSDNDAYGSGGAVYIESYNETPATRLTNCSFALNSAATTGGVFYSGSNPGGIVRNGILWQNTQTQGPADQSAQIQNVSVVNYTVIQNCSSYCSVPADKNLATNPNFVDANGIDNIAGTADDNLRLNRPSSAIDSGSNPAVRFDTLDLNANANFLERIPRDRDNLNRFTDDPATANTGEGTAPIVDRGAYEFQPPQPCIADLNLDGSVTLADVVVVLKNFGPTTTADPIDLNNDGQINMIDLTEVAEYISIQPCLAAQLLTEISNQ